MGFIFGLHVEYFWGFILRGRGIMCLDGWSKGIELLGALLPSAVRMLGVECGVCVGMWMTIEASCLK